MDELAGEDREGQGDGMTQESKEKQCSWGGARAGAGRNTTGQRGKTTNLNFRLAPEELAAIKKLAEQSGKPVSRHLVDLSIAQIKQQ